MRILAPFLLLAAVAAAEHVTADLVADAESVAPGGRIRVGVRFRMDPHWHLYWKNPGDSGLAPSVQWKLPEGVTASAIAWPAPRRIPTPPFMTFGYEFQVVLSSEISVPATYTASTLPIGADLEWLVCDPEQCIPGEASVATEIPVRAGEASRKPIAQDLPVAAGEMSARYQGGRIALLAAAAPGAPSFFFPEEPGTIEPSEPQDAQPKGLLLTPSKSREGPVTVLRGVLTFESGPAWEVEVTVEPEGRSGNRRKWWLIPGVAILLASVALKMLRSRKERTS